METIRKDQNQNPNLSLSPNRRIEMDRNHQVKTKTYSLTAMILKTINNQILSKKQTKLEWFATNRNK